MISLFIWIAIAVAVIVLFLIIAGLYRIVPADESHVVIQGKKVRVFSPYVTPYNPKGKSAYFHIPSWFFPFGLGMKVHRIPLRQLSISVPNFLAFDKDRARFVCNIVAYVVVNDPVISARRFSGDIQYLKDEVSKQVQAITRDATTKKPIREIINDRQSILEQIDKPLKSVLSTWGLDLTDMELIEFKDPVKGEDGGKPSHVISDISSIIEEQINSEARQKNAEQIKIARIKEAEADELGKKREIERDEIVSKREQEKKKLVAEQEKLAREKELEVTKVQEVKTAEINKAKAIVKAEEEKATEEIMREQKKLEGEGDRLRAEEIAKGEASPIREKGKAEAEAKELLQSALNKFGDNAIRSLVAEKIVDMQKEVGIATAQALEKADVKVFAGEDSKSAFDLGKMISALQTSNESSAQAVLNYLARPHDLGLSGLSLGKEDGKDTKDIKDTKDVKDTNTEKVIKTENKKK
jgi:flotillin